jgi:transcription elongation GreA/GreB family factor
MHCDAWSQYSPKGKFFDRLFLNQAALAASDCISSSILVAMQPIKQLLYNLCCEYVAQRIAEAMQAIADTQEAVNNETKSTAGDKYETSREMMQQEINRDTGRLYELKKLEAALHLISPDGHSSLAQAGSVIRTNHGNYYLCISAGQLQGENETYHALSPGTPLGQRMLGRKAGDTFEFNGRTYEVHEVI